jgi:membrane fusion protein (multidrug efflux system)
VRSAAQARVGTLSGGAVLSLAVEAGDLLLDQQEIARVRGATGTEVVVAPFGATVTSLLVNVGDTLAPGAIIATVGDLTRLQVETTEVDEFLIPCVQRGQSVVVLVDALRERELTGRVRSMALEPRLTTEGDEHYPVTIELASAPPDLRPGMSVRVRFGE